MRGKEYLKFEDLLLGVAHFLQDSAELTLGIVGSLGSSDAVHHTWWTAYHNHMIIAWGWEILLN